MREHTFVEFLEALKLGCEAAFARCIDDENDFALELFEREGSALLIVGLKIVEARC